MSTEEGFVHLQPATDRHETAGPLSCRKCGVTANAEVTVHQETTILGEKWPPLCRHCSQKVERMRSLSRRTEA